MAGKIGDQNQPNQPVQPPSHNNSEVRNEQEINDELVALSPEKPKLKNTRGKNRAKNLQVSMCQSELAGEDTIELGVLGVTSSSEEKEEEGNKEQKSKSKISPASSKESQTELTKSYSQNLSKNLKSFGYEAQHDSIYDMLEPSENRKHQDK